MGRDLSLGEKSGSLAGPCQTSGSGFDCRGGRFLIRNKPAETYEAGINERVVLIEFDSVEQAIAAHATPAYKEALKTLGTGNVERDVRVVDGA